MKISLFQGILFGVFGIGAMIGLYVFATHTSTTGGGDTAIGTIVIWGTLPKADIQAALASVVQSEPLLKDVSYVQKDRSTIPADLAAAIATGGAPDLILVSQEELYSLAKLVEPIPFSTLPISSFNDAFIEEGKILAAPDGAGYYGLPFLVDPLVL